MEPLIEVADEELPPEARALLDPAVPIPEDVEFTQEVTAPGVAAVGWWLGCLAGLSCGFLFAAEVPAALASEYTIEKVFGLGSPLLFFFGAFACGKAARRAKGRAAELKAGRWRGGLFIAPGFILWGKSGQRSCLLRPHVGTVQVQTVHPREAGGNPYQRALIGYRRSGDGIEGWLELPNQRGLSERDAVARVARWAALDGKLVRGEKVGAWKWESTAQAAD